LYVLKLSPFILTNRHLFKWCDPVFIDVQPKCCRSRVAVLGLVFRLSLFVSLVVQMKLVIHADRHSAAENI